MQQPQAYNWTELNVNQGQWQFVEGGWSQGVADVIMPPYDLGDLNLAVCTDSAYQDFEASFEFRWDVGVTNAGFVFGAANSRQYTMLHFPVVGQQYRSESFWAFFSKVDESGYARVLHMQMVLGITSAIGVWHDVRLQVAGNQFQAWIDGRPTAKVSDDGGDAQPGCVGLCSDTGMGYSARSSFRNVRIRGQVAQTVPWDPAPQPVRNWFRIHHPQGCSSGSIARAANDELLVAAEGTQMLSSKDNGRTWTHVAEVPQHVLGGHMHLADDGRLENYLITKGPPFDICVAESPDHGRTWPQPRTLGRIELPADHHFQAAGLQRLIKLHDGALLMFALGRTIGTSCFIHGRFHHEFEPPGCLNFVMRSTDGGRTWTGPTNIDGPPHDDRNMLYNDHASEISAAQSGNGRIITLVRPLHSPFMWESWSDDGGITWTPQARGPFPMYACNASMISTQSGALVVAGRFPGIAVQVSHDHGITWKCNMIDSAIWANGAMFEVEPDVVLYVYGGKNWPFKARELRAQLMRITPDGVEPVRRPGPADPPLIGGDDVQHRLHDRIMPLWMTDERVPTRADLEQFPDVAGESVESTDADLSATVRALCDDQYLYVAVELTGSERPDAPAQARQPANPWGSSDSVEIFVCVDPEADRRRWRFTPADFQFALPLSGDEGEPMVYCANRQEPVPDARLAVSVKPAEDGWKICAVIPWAYMGEFRPPAGLQIGWDFAVNLAAADGETLGERMPWSGSDRQFIEPHVWGLARIQRRD